MPRAHIIDRTPLTTRKITDDGFLRAQATITRAGILEYDAADLGVGEPGTTVRVMRTPDTVFDSSSRASMRGTPVTLQHPATTEGVTPDNWQDVTVGNLVGEPRKAGNRMDAEVLVGSKHAIDALASGTDQLSIGYSFDFKEAPAGAEYDFVSDGPLHVNHVAIVDQGRAGATVRVHDQETPEMDMKAIKAAVTDAVANALPQSTDKTPAAADGRAVADAVVAAIQPALDAVQKTANDAAAQRAEEAAVKEAELRKAEAKKHADALVAATIKERDEYHVAVADALTFIPAEKHAEMRSKALREVLLTAVGDSIPGATELSDEALRGAVLALKQARAAAQAAAGSRDSTPIAPLSVLGGGNSREEAYRRFVDGFQRKPQLHAVK